ncbi:hypothetical protein SAMN05421788_10964 [Filimonas lacunae]|uniref:Uncharacterized protein n=1 Tax=Filimonas lacunae TaxID=477680 RepID=A0A173MIZ4_9BACT|nr:hypothetical protein [Filimonas lacunae]BAV07585.1 hypothetical protein FLA_3611 [Filimonas lacunae]SIT29873.1 hypothetical protein SAMN05421788_10964 [Filimonas lacunae]
MKQEHLTDKELQEWALGQAAMHGQQAAHVQACARCTAAVANYQALFSAIHAMEKPALEVDMAALVMAHLPVATSQQSVEAAAKRAFPRLQLLLAVAAITVVIVTLLVMSSYFKGLLQGVDHMLFSLLVVTVLTITLFQCRELWVLHRKKMNQLKFY